jgi:hypothetical protein
MGAGGAAYTGPLFTVNEFDVGRYNACIEGGRLPVARRFTFRSLAASVYYAFWQAYAGIFDIARIIHKGPRRAARAFHSASPG